MNQILSVEMPNKSKNIRSGSKANIKSVIMFFAIVLVIFAAVLAGVGIYLYLNKSGESPEDPQRKGSVITGTQANIDVEILQGNAKLNIIVTHDKQISSISSKWNDEAPVEQTDIGQTNFEFTIDIPQGKNTLVITVTDINGVTTTTEPKEYGEDGLKLTIEKGNPVKIIAESNVNISYISYNWDGEDEKQIQVNSMSTEQIVPVMEGEHILNVVVVDSSGAEATDSQTIVGTRDDTEPPVVNVSTDGNNFIIKATDEKGLSKIIVFDYTNQKTVKEVEIAGEKEYTLTVPLQDGENKMVITAYDLNQNETKIGKIWKKE